MGNFYMDFIIKCIPKVITQVDRDKHSKTYGCCDRNYWHLKIRDFPSAILQQTGLTLALLYKNNFEGNIFYNNEDVFDWAKSTVYFWKKIQLNDGSFNEYYPNEHGFPPTAFSLYSSCEVYKILKMKDEAILNAFKKTGKYLINHIEEKACNQEIASITALYSLFTITNEKWILDGLNNKLNKVLKLQSKEGWFPEYGGVDIGYLSVSLDMLAEYYYMSNDERVLVPLNKMIEFIKYFVHPDGTIGGEYGSRNTTYFLPNGLEVMAQLDNEDAVAIKNYIYKDSNKSYFFLDAVDDRYCSHYLLHSFLRALVKEEVIKTTNNQLPHEYNNSIYFEEAGIFIKRQNNSYAIAGLKKGGILKLYIDKKEQYIDCGYRVNYGDGKVAATNWQDASYLINICDNELEVSGNFNVVNLKIPSPFMNFGLRVAAKLFGNRIINFLKRMIIFVDKHNDIIFNRKIIFTENDISIYDKIISPKEVDIEAATNFSLRHVASGKFFSISDLCHRNHDEYKKIKILNIKKIYNFSDNELFAKRIE